jgi:DNA-binding transcriptional ArsR family regulator
VDDWLRDVNQSRVARYAGGPMNPTPTPPPPPTRRPPTAAEAKALGHPLRLRILFACRERARTNKELAEALGTTPGTIHYHLRQLVAQGFLQPEEPRVGKRGSTEQPYRSTGRSWQLSGTAEGSRVLLRAGADEVAAAADDDVLTLTRLGLSLRPADLAELLERLNGLVEEFAGRSLTSPDATRAPVGGETESVALFVALHRSADAGDEEHPSAPAG